MNDGAQVKPTCLCTMGASDAAAIRFNSLDMVVEGNILWQRSGYLGVICVGEYIYVYNVW